MIKVICINNKNLNLKLDKVYDALYIHKMFPFKGEIYEQDFYEILNENNVKVEYLANRFILLTDFRNQQIDSILND